MKYLFISKYSLSFLSRNNLRLVIFRLLDLIASRGIFGAISWETSPSGLGHAHQRQGHKATVQAILLDLIQGARHFLETEEKQDSLAQLQVRPRLLKVGTVQIHVVFALNP